MRQKIPAGALTRNHWPYSGNGRVAATGGSMEAPGISRQHATAKGMLPLTEHINNAAFAPTGFPSHVIFMIAFVVGIHVKWKGTEMIIGNEYHYYLNDCPFYCLSLFRNNHHHFPACRGIALCFLSSRINHWLVLVRNLRPLQMQASDLTFSCHLPTKERVSKLLRQ